MGVGEGGGGGGRGYKGGGSERERGRLDEGAYAVNERMGTTLYII